MKSRSNLQSIFLLLAVLCESVFADDNSREPNWTLILLVIILTSAIGAGTGIFLLSRKPRIAEPPLFKDSLFLGSDDPVMTTYKQFPMEYNGVDHDDMYPMTVRYQHPAYNYGDQVTTQAL